jgi:hypothetical protein
MKRTTSVRKWMLVIGVITLVGAWSGTGLAAETDTADHDVTITVNEVAELAINETATAAVTIGAPATGGDALETTWSNNDSSYLQYTSVVDDMTYRKITVVTSSELPPGVSLQVTPTSAGDKQGELVSRPKSFEHKLGNSFSA